jgi:hypothetical protein
MQRPTSVKVLGVLGMLWSGPMLLIGVPFLIAFLIDPKGLFQRLNAWTGSVSPSSPTVNDTIIEIIATDPTAYAVAVVSISVGMIVYGILFVGSWKLLAMQETGRKLVLAFAVIFIAMQVIQPVVDRLLLSEAQQQAEVRELISIPIPCDWLYVLSALYFLTRPAVKEAMQSSTQRRSGAA